MAACPGCGKELPADGLLFCPWCATPLPQGSGGQRKVVSIVFADLVNSTALGSGLDPEVLRGVLAQYWSAAREVLRRHGGTVEKFIGDAVVGVFGIPVLREDDALRAVRAAADLLAAMDAVAEASEATVGQRLRVRVGVNTGEVLASDGAGAMALLAGDAANVAARLEQSAGPGEVLLGASTYELVRGAVEADSMPPLLVKGKPEPLRAFRLRSVAPASAGPARRRRFTGPMVGRDRQLTLGRTAYETARDERGCVLLTVVGEPGVGKSRLVGEFIASLGEEPLVLTGRCLPYGEGITYAPLADMLLRLAERLPGGVDAALDPADAQHERVAAGLAALQGASTATVGESAWAFRQLVEALAQDRPVVLVVDDVQWAEDGLLDLLDHLVDRSRDAPVLVVVMARPEFLDSRPCWGNRRQNAITTLLRPLSERDTASLVTALLSGGDAGERSEAVSRLVERILTAAEGVPLFVEEVLAMLADEGALTSLEDGGWALRDPLADIGVPPGVHALLAARLDAVELSERRVLDAAAVVGTIFYPTAVAALLGEDVEDQVERLERTDLVRATATDLPGVAAYGFRHALVRETAYAAVPKERRAELHRRFAGWLRERPDAPADALVGFHLAAGARYLDELGRQDPDLAADAVRTLVAAADRSGTLRDLHAAGALLAQASSLLPARSLLGAQVALRRSSILDDSGRFEEAMQWADRARDAAESLGLMTAAAHARVLHEISRFNSARVSDSVASRAVADEALAVLRGSDDDLALAAVYRLLAWADMLDGAFSLMDEHARLGLHHARRAGSSHQLSDLVLWRVFPYWWGSGTLAEEQQVVRDLEADLGDEPLLAEVVEDVRRMLRAHEGDDADLSSYAWGRAERLLEDGAPLWAVHWLGDFLVDPLVWRGRYQEALAALEEAVRICAQVDETSVRSTQLAQMSVVLTVLGRGEEAKAAAEQSRGLAQGDILNEILLGTTLGLLAARAGDERESEEWFEHALSLAAGTEFTAVSSSGWWLMSLAREQLGDRAGALEAIREYERLWQTKGFVPPLEAARRRIAELAAEPG